MLGRRFNPVGVWAWERRAAEYTRPYPYRRNTSLHPLRLSSFGWLLLIGRNAGTGLLLTNTPNGQI